MQVWLENACSRPFSGGLRGGGKVKDDNDTAKEQTSNALNAKLRFSLCAMSAFEEPKASTSVSLIGSIDKTGRVSLSRDRC